MSQNDNPVAGLLARIGLEGAEPDEDGIHTLFVDDRLPVMLGTDADGERLFLYAGVGSLDGSGPDHATRVMLEGNLAAFQEDGFALGIAPETDLVFLLARERLVGQSDEQLFDLFDRFVDAADSWHAYLNAGSAEEVEQATHAAVAEPTPEEMHLRPGDLA